MNNEPRQRMTTRDFIRASFANDQYGLELIPIQANNFKPDSVTIQLIRERLFNGFSTCGILFKFVMISRSIESHKML